LGATTWVAKPCNAAGLACHDIRPGRCAPAVLQPAHTQRSLRRSSSFTVSSSVRNKSGRSGYLHCTLCRNSASDPTLGRSRSISQPTHARSIFNDLDFRVALRIERDRLRLLLIQYVRLCIKREYAEDICDGQIHSMPSEWRHTVPRGSQAKLQSIFTYQYHVDTAMRIPCLYSKARVGHNTEIIVTENMLKRMTPTHTHTLLKVQVQRAVPLPANAAKSKPLRPKRGE